jgi:hypothetical protein
VIASAAGRMALTWGNSSRITNFEYDERYPRSDDPALFAIYSMLWFAYSDVRKHRMDGKYALSSEGRQVVENCILFLRTITLTMWKKGVGFDPQQLHRQAV